jgi:prevent-host-death family protein
MQVHEWSLQDAKNKFSAVVDAAQTGEAQVVTRRGVPAAVVVSVELFERLQQQEKAQAPSFIDHLLAMPRKADAVFERSGFSAREVDFGDKK